MPLITDPIDLALDTSGDVVVTKGELSFTSGLEGVAQGVRQRLLTFQGEWFLDLDHGVPYFENILGQRFDETAVRVAFAEAITSTPGVNRLLKLVTEFNRSNRLLSVTWEANTIFGNTPADTLEVIL
jgi:hypothetical protein